MTARESGMRGEGIALAYLEGLGYTLVEKNYRSRYGEIDLVMRDAETTVFVEVKLRKSTSHGGPLEYVTHAKQEKLRITAEQYLAERDAYSDDSRFDVVGIVDGDPARIEHVRDAF